MSDTYRPGTGLQAWARTLPPSIQAGKAISGHGSPEAVVPAPPGKLYTDVDNRDIYQKERGTSALGWILRGKAAVGSTAGSGQVSGLLFLTVAQRDAWMPSAAYAACLMIDSDPPFMVSIWADGVWN